MIIKQNKVNERINNVNFVSSGNPISNVCVYMCACVCVCVCVCVYVCVCVCSCVCVCVCVCLCACVSKDSGFVHFIFKIQSQE